jgi:cytochrome P450
MLVGAANRDPSVHQNPDQYDIHIKRSKQALSFGVGHHMCMGMHLARLEMDIALNALLDHLPNLRLDPEGGYEGIRGIQFRSPTAIPVVWDAG